MHTAASVPAGSRSSHISSLRLHLKDGGPENTVVTNVVYVLAAAAVVSSALIHLHLWMNGYRHLPTIGPLFLAQVIAGAVVALLVLVVRNVLASIIAFVFVASTLGGFLISINVGLFGFQDSFSAPYAHMAFIVEIVTLVLCLAAAILSVRQASRR
jgi:hypothetical protein